MEGKKKSLFKSFLIYAIIIAGIFLVVYVVGAPENKVQKLSYNELLKWVESDLRIEHKLEGGDKAKTIKSIIIVENELVGITDSSAISDKNFSTKNDQYSGDRGRLTDIRPWCTMAAYEFTAPKEKSI